MAEFNRYEINSIEININDGILKEYVKDNFLPEDVYDEKMLHDWAIENGYKEEE